MGLALCEIHLVLSKVFQELSGTIPGKVIPYRRADQDPSARYPSHHARHYTIGSADGGQLCGLQQEAQET
ncbi:hypothetical protein VUR80DRAFT_4130 [Thermomyces stellatus]